MNDADIDPSVKEGDFRQKMAFWNETRDIVRAQQLCVAGGEDLFALQREQNATLFQQIFHPKSIKEKRITVPLPYGSGNFQVAATFKRALSRGYEGERIFIIDNQSKTELVLSSPDISITLLHRTDSTAFPTTGTVQVPIPLAWPWIAELGHEQYHLRDDLVGVPEVIRTMIRIEAYRWLKNHELERPVVLEALGQSNSKGADPLIEVLIKEFWFFGYRKPQDVFGVLEEPHSKFYQEALLFIESSAAEAGVELVIRVLEFMGDAVPEADFERLVLDTRLYTQSALASYSYWKRFYEKPVKDWDYR